MRYPTPFIWRDGEFVLDDRVVQRYRDCGVCEQLFSDWLSVFCPVGSLKHRVFTARAYDNAHGTDTSLDFPPIADLPTFETGADDAA